MRLRHLYFPQTLKILHCSLDSDASVLNLPTYIVPINTVWDSSLYNIGNSSEAEYYSLQIKKRNEPLLQNKQTQDMTVFRKTSFIIFKITTMIRVIH